MRRTRRRVDARWSALAVSGLLHTSVMVYLSATLQPMDLGQVGKFLLTAETATEPPALDALYLPDLETDDSPPGEGFFDLAEGPGLMADLGNGLELSVDQNAIERAPSIPELPEDLATEIVPVATEEKLSGARRRRREAKQAGKQASFFGTVAEGDTFVYVLDMSGSMKGPRFARACGELIDSVQGLREKQQFYVLLFNDAYRRMFDDQTVTEDAVRATAENKRRLRQWLSKIQAGGGTDPREALRIGLALRPSALFLLSDGQFNLDKSRSGPRLRHGDTTPAELVGKLAPKKVPIHTFAFESQGAVATMQELADKTGGEYRFIAAGPPDSSAPQPPGQPAPQQAAPPNGILAIQESQALLSLAEAMEAQGNLQGALGEYQKIVDNYPQTTAAVEAKLHKDLLSLLVPR